MLTVRSCRALNVAEWNISKAFSQCIKYYNAKRHNLPKTQRHWKYLCDHVSHAHNAPIAPTHRLLKLNTFPNNNGRKVPKMVLTRHTVADSRGHKHAEQSKCRFGIQIGQTLNNSARGEALSSEFQTSIIPSALRYKTREHRTLRIVCR